MSLRLLSGLLLSGVLLVACAAETGPERVRIPVFVQGSARDSLQLEEATFQLSRADVAFGPLYFCAASGADAELCETAVAEFVGYKVFDALNAEETRAFELQGVTGSVRSALYDYGVSWFTTEQAPEPKTELGHSAVLEGVLTLPARELSFVARIDLAPRTRGGLAVFGQPTRHDLQQGDELRIVLDPYQWLRAINIDALLALDPTDTGKVEIVPDSQAYEAILQGMQNRAPVEFVWE